MSEIEPVRQAFSPLWAPEERTGHPPPGSGAMFDRIAGRYDLLNRLMTFGLDRRWRRLTVAALDLEPGCRILDLATGTADMALEVLCQCSEAQVVGLDPSAHTQSASRSLLMTWFEGPVNEYHRLKLRSPHRDWPTADVQCHFGLNGALPAVERLRMTDGQKSRTNEFALSSSRGARKTCQSSASAWDMWGVKHAEKALRAPQMVTKTL